MMGDVFAIKMWTGSKHNHQDGIYADTLFKTEERAKKWLKDEGYKKVDGDYYNGKYFSRIDWIGCLEDEDEK